MGRHLIVVPEIENRDNRGEAIFEDRLGDISPKLKEELSSQIQEAQEIPNSLIKNLYTDISGTEEHLD